MRDIGEVKVLLTVMIAILVLVSISPFITDVAAGADNKTRRKIILAAVIIHDY